MRPGVALLTALMLSGCSSSGPAMPRMTQGPDAALSANPTQTGDVRIVVMRPVRDRQERGPAAVDQRTLVAVLQPDRAVWLSSARLDAASAMPLLAAMDASLQDAPPATQSQVTLTLAKQLPPVDALGRRVVEGGGWRWVGKTGSGPDTRCHLSLDDAQGRTLARLTMDTAAAAALMRDLDRAVRTAPERLTTGASMETGR